MMILSDSLYEILLLTLCEL